MSDISQTADQGRSGGMVWIATLALAANIFVIVTVNYWIYHARAVFIARHPDYVSVQPPTISRAISDPLIGEPFAFWITLSAVVLAFGVLGIGLVYLRMAQGLAPGRGRVALQVTVLLLVAAQASSSIGMHMLSAYRFPDNNAAHMVGSTLFFVAQSLVVVLSVALCSMVLANKSAMDGLELDGPKRRMMVVWRRRLGYLSIALSVVYMALFLTKGLDLGAVEALHYNVYVLIEPVVISSFLVVLGAFQPDLWAVIRRRFGG